jgi:late competence protein required for DNA uptake (superfamily II DNA/RNA helicase)
MAQKTKHYIVSRNDALLEIRGPLHTGLQKLLSYEEKSLEARSDKPWIRQTKKRRVQIYEREEHPEGGYVYTTFQGMFDRVLGVLIETGCSFDLLDRRMSFPKPAFDRMHGMRFSQEPMLRQALSADRSGLIVAVTRYGKTAMIANTINAYPGVKTVVVAPGIDLLPQLEGALRYFCPDRDIKGIYTGSRNTIQGDDITVCSVDSIHKLDKEGTRLILVDEPHAVATGPRSAELASFSCVRMLGFGATVSGRWDGSDVMITGLFGPKLVEKTYLEAVEEGAIAPIHVKFIRIPFKHWQVQQRDAAYRNLYNSPAYLEALSKVCNQVVPQDWQTLIFISNEKMANSVAEVVDNAKIAMDKLMKNKKERHELFQQLKEGVINRCVCSSIYSTGVTIDGIRVAVNCAVGAAGIMSVQKPGRLAEVKEGKTAGYMIDFLFECETPKETTEGIPWNRRAWSMVVNDCWARYNAYKEIGYDVEILDSPDNLKLI